MNREDKIVSIGLILFCSGIIGLGVLLSYATPYKTRTYYVRIACNSTYIYIVGTDSLPNSTHIYSTPQGFKYEAKDLYFIIYNVNGGTLIVNVSYYDHVSFWFRYEMVNSYSDSFNVTRGFSWNG